MESKLNIGDLVRVKSLKLWSPDGSPPTHITTADQVDKMYRNKAIELLGNIGIIQAIEAEEDDRYPAGRYQVTSSGRDVKDYWLLTEEDLELVFTV